MDVYVDNPFINPKILSYCPGFLGLERGLKRAIGSIRTVAYVEIEAFIIENLLAGMEAGVLDAAPIWANLKTFDAKPFRGCVDIIMGGYPCQPFSTAGDRKGTDDPRHLYPYLEQHIDIIRPVCCFFENVGGHLSLGFAEVRASLSAMGYAVEAGIFTAEEVGAPHRRERLFILAIRKDWLANTISVNRGLSESERWREGLQTSGGSELAYANCSRLAQLRNNRITPEEDDPGIGLPGATFSNTNIKGLQGGIRQQFGSVSEQDGPFKGGKPCGIYAENWPAPAGQQQHSWEEPRTTEPGLGCTVNGYNFREDLLRAYGNSVVEQTAELAFRTLLKKHGL